jgi:nucleoside-diphosphate-sugar epimerase
MRVLVTGAGGFIGAHVTKALVRGGHDVCALERPEASAARLADCAAPLRLVRADLRDTQTVEKILRDVRPECAIHLAWYAVAGKYWTAPENLDCVSMTIALAQALARVGCGRLVGVGSCAEYDWDYGFLSEARTPLHPRTLYGACKNATRILLEAFCERESIRFAWARLFYLYGPTEDPARLVPSVALALLRGETARCTEGTQVRDFLHVDDVAAAIGAVALSDCRGAVNIGSGEPTSVRTIIELIGQALGRADRIAYGAIPRNPDDPPMVVADIRRLRDEVGWRPSVPLREGLARVVAWWRENSPLPGRA